MDLTPWPGVSGAKCEKNMFKFWSSLKTQILKAMEKYHDSQIIVVCHSRGGSIAYMAALALAELDYDVQVFTYGAPKIGNTAFQQYYNSKVPDTWRVVNQKDPITQLPPGNILHVGTELWFKVKTDTTPVCNGAQCSVNESDDIATLSEETQIFGKLKSAVQKGAAAVKKGVAAVKNAAKKGAEAVKSAVNKGVAAVKIGAAAVKKVAIKIKNTAKQIKSMIAHITDHTSYFDDKSGCTLQ